MKREAGDALDHLLVGAPTLETGIAWLEERTGVRAATGGSHPGLGTWNALASLGSRQYLEIIAPDPAQPHVDTFYVPGLRKLRQPAIVTWAARRDDLASFVGEMPSGFSCDPPRRGSRVRPDGRLLAWTLAFPRHLDHDNFDGALPFFIEWASTDTHPGRSAPPGLQMRAFSIRHPEATKVSEALVALGLECAVRESKAVSMAVELETPRGRVVL